MDSMQREEKCQVMSCHDPKTHHRLGRTERIVVIMDLKGIPSALLNRDFLSL
jgi:hypothetical protein